MSTDAEFDRCFLAALTGLAARWSFGGEPGDGLTSPTRLAQAAVRLAQAAMREQRLALAGESAVEVPLAGLDALKQQHAKALERIQNLEAELEKVKTYLKRRHKPAPSAAGTLPAANGAAIHPRKA